MFHQALGCLFGQTLWYWGNDLDPGIMYFPTKWGAFFHRIHGTGIYTYMKTMKINHPYMGVSKYPSRILKNLLHRMREVSFPPKRKIALPDTFGTSDGTWFSFENNKIRVEFMELGPEAKNPSANSNLSWPQEISVLFISFFLGSTSSHIEVPRVPVDLETHFRQQELWVGPLQPVIFFFGDVLLLYFSEGPSNSSESAVPRTATVLYYPCIRLSRNEVRASLVQRP